jgi:hypothetical protein
MQADAAGDAGAEIAVLERLQTALLARDEVAKCMAGIEQVRLQAVALTRRISYRQPKAEDQAHQQKHVPGSTLVICAA